VAETMAELPRGFLFTLTNRSAIDHHVVIVGNAIDADKPKGKRSKAHEHEHSH
jgi:hypothetical protein